MQVGLRYIDHLVYAVHDLDAAMQFVEDKLGIRPTLGGRHLLKGTKNALLAIGDKCYLELLALDEENHDIPAPRWMGIDLLKEPKITRWALTSPDLKSDQDILRAYKPELAKLERGQRTTPDGDNLSWQMILPLATPEVELIPFVIDWKTSEVHPTDALTNHSCILEGIELQMAVPRAETQECLDRLNTGLQISAGKVTGIKVVISGPKGTISL